MEADNQHQELENNKDLSENLTEKKVFDFEEPAAITWLKEQYSYFQSLTAKNVSDNMWLIGFKFFLKAIMVLILIIMSPFILFFILFSLLIAG